MKLGVDFWGFRDILLTAPSGAFWRKIMAHSSTRRGFIGAAGVTGLVALAPAQTTTQTAISSAVLQGIVTSGTRVYNRLRANTLSGGDIRGFAGSLQTLFGNLDEIGATPKLQAIFRSYPWEPLTWDQLSTVRATAATAGIAMTDSEFSWFYSQQNQAMPEIRSSIFASGGLDAFHANIITAIDAFATFLDNNKGIAKIGDARLKVVQGSGVFWACFSAALAGLYTGVWGYMAWLEVAPYLTLLAASPVGQAALIIAGLILSIIGMYCAFGG
jgi:hypothetical protein